MKSEILFCDNDLVCFVSSQTKTGVAPHSTQSGCDNFQLVSLCRKPFTQSAINTSRSLSLKAPHDIRNDFANFGIEQ